MCEGPSAGPTFRRLYRVAGGAGSQSLIYSGSFEIIKLTHLSDGERRNAKRSPGEVPAAPTPNLSCLQIAQSLHHNRWDSCLSFLPLPHTNGLRRGECPPHFYTLHRLQRGIRKSQTRGANRQRHVLYTAAETNTKSLPLTLCQASSPRRRSLSALIPHTWLKTW